MPEVLEGLEGPAEQRAGSAPKEQLASAGPLRFKSLIRRDCRDCLGWHQASGSSWRSGLLGKVEALHSGPILGSPRFLRSEDLSLDWPKGGFLFRDAQVLDGLPGSGFSPRLLGPPPSKHLVVRIHAVEGREEQWPQREPGWPRSCQPQCAPCVNDRHEKPVEEAIQPVCGNGL